jgi:ribosomal-protein-alanine N-acetyltransferase
VSKSESFLQGAPPARAGSPCHNVAIRAAHKGDLSRALEIERATFTHYPLGRRQFRYHQQNPSAIFMVAQIGGEVVGDAIGLIRKHKSGVTGRVYSLVVDSRFRGMGIGAKLFAAIVRKLESRGAARIYLEVAHDNRTAIAIYERFGFRRVGLLRDYYARRQHAIHMLYARH